MWWEYLLWIGVMWGIAIVGFFAVAMILDRTSLHLFDLGYGILLNLIGWLFFAAVGSLVLVAALLVSLV